MHFYLLLFSALIKNFFAALEDLTGILFVIINDLDDWAERTLSKFTGDTKLGGVTDMSESCAAIQRDLDTLQKWGTGMSGSLTRRSAKSCT